MVLNSLKIAAICHTSLGVQTTSLPSSILLSSLPSRGLSRGSGVWTPQRVWAEPAHPLTNILMQFIQSNSFIKSTLMFNELSLQKSPCMQSSATVGRNDTMDCRPWTGWAKKVDHCWELITCNSDELLYRDTCMLNVSLCRKISQKRMVIEYKLIFNAVVKYSSQMQQRHFVKQINNLQPKLNLAYFNLKMWHLVATILTIFLRIN